MKDLLLHRSQGKKIVFQFLCLFHFLYLSSSFPTYSARSATTTILQSTKSPVVKEMDITSEYSDAQLQDALNELLNGSSDPSRDGRHIYGFQDPNHKLSMLQRITATRILDYGSFMSDPNAPSHEDLMQQFQSFSTQHGPIINLQQVIRSQSPRMALAAEFKRASPSKGDIAPHLHAGEQAEKYSSAGANIISVLTEPRWFKGSLQDMTDARIETSGKSYPRPAILRKEFVINKYQITEAAAGGADTILLIVAILPQHVLKELIDHARSLGMEPLVEVHADEELEVALEAGAKVIGVNNRNLHTFQMDLKTTEHVAEQLKKQGCVFDHNDPNSEYTICSLSGMSTALDVDRYRKIKVGMCLIGESLMRAADPKLAIEALCLDPEDFSKQSAFVPGGAYTAGTKLIKVCGITNPNDALVACRAGANLIGVIFVPKSKRCVTPEQAKDVVTAVRSFGERTDRTELDIMPQENTLNQLLSSARALEEASKRPLVVGVFQNQPFEYIKEMVKSCGLDLVQLHGSEGMNVANVDHCGVPAIRVVDIETDPETGKATGDAADKLLSSLTSDPVAILLDTSLKGNKNGGGGGTGVTFDWNIAEQIQNAGLPVIVAGGLTPVNIQEAVGTIRPWGVDVSSGVEEENTPGVKNHKKVQDFLVGARKAATEASLGI